MPGAAARAAQGRGVVGKGLHTLGTPMPPTPQTRDCGPCGVPELVLWNWCDPCLRQRIWIPFQSQKTQHLDILHTILSRIPIQIHQVFKVQGSCTQESPSGLSTASKRVVGGWACSGRLG